MEGFDETEWRVAVNRKLNAIEICLAISNLISLAMFFAAVKMGR